MREGRREGWRKEAEAGHEGKRISQPVRKKTNTATMNGYREQ